MSVTYRPAPEVEKIAKRLIDQHHLHLQEVRIDYVFRSEAANTAGKAVWGKARKVGGLNAYLSRTAEEGDDEVDPADISYFVVEIAADVWSVLDRRQRSALVDHELSHCRVKLTNDGLRLYVAPHDLEEFVAIVERHGLWQADVVKFLDAAKASAQLKLDEAVVA